MAFNNPLPFPSKVSLARNQKTATTNNTRTTTTMTSTLLQSNMNRTTMREEDPLLAKIPDFPEFLTLDNDYDNIKFASDSFGQNYSSDWKDYDFGTPDIEMLVSSYLDDATDTTNQTKRRKPDRISQITQSLPSVPVIPNMGRHLPQSSTQPAWLQQAASKRSNSPPQTSSASPHPRMPQKRTNYDVLSSFFKVYFQPDPQNTLLKDVVYNLYWRKIVPIITRNAPTNGPIQTSNNMNSTTTPLAKNAVFRKMWSVFKDHELATGKDTNNNDCIKGLKLVESINDVMIGLEKDVDLLRQYFGQYDLFDFSLEELEQDTTPMEADIKQQQLTSPQITSPLPIQPVGSVGNLILSSSSSEESREHKSGLLARIERLEQLSALVTSELTDLKNLVKKEMYEIQARKRKAQQQS